MKRSRILARLTLIVLAATAASTHASYSEQWIGPPQLAREEAQASHGEIGVHVREPCGALLAVKSVTAPSQRHRDAWRSVREQRPDRRFRHERPRHFPAGSSLNVCLVPAEGGFRAQNPLPDGGMPARSNRTAAATLWRNLRRARRAAGRISKPHSRRARNQMNSLTIIPTPVTDTPTGGRVIDIGKGSHLVLNGHQGNSPYDVFMMALMGSISRGGKPVRCANFVRGVALLLDSSMPPVSGEEAESLFDFIYASVEPALKAWLGRGPGVEPLCHEILGITARFAHASHLEWLPGVLPIDVENPYEINVFEPAQRPDSNSLPSSPAPQSPVFPAARPGNHQHSVRYPATPKTEAALAIDQAIMRGIDALDSPYATLPFPVRYRAAGAMQAWAEARHAAAGPGANLEAALGDARTSPFELIDDAVALVHSHLNFDPHDHANLYLITTTSVSVPMQAFWLRKGALFEPTDALEQLLKLSDVGDDMPLAAVACGARTLCIVPRPSLRHGPDGIDSITVFDHTGLPTGAVSERWLTFIAAKVRTSDQDELMAPVLRIFHDDGTMTIREAVRRYCIAGKGTPVGDAAGREFWTRVLSYAFKILFYLSSEQPQITQDNAYSNAPRNFSGLGKRRKGERLREIEQLYDRYIVGPEILPSLHERGAVREGTGDGGEVPPHWRRGHFRLQRHGPARSRTRVVLTMPIIVRADRLKADSLR